MDIWIPVLVALVTGALSFMASTSKSSKNIQAVKLENESKLEQIKQQHKDELERMEKEHLTAIKQMEMGVDLKLKEYGGTKETDIKYGFLNTILEQAIANPQKAVQTIQGLQQLSDSAKQMTKGNENK